MHLDLNENSPVQIPDIGRNPIYFNFEESFTNTFLLNLFLLFHHAFPDAPPSYKYRYHPQASSFLICGLYRATATSIVCCETEVV